MFINTNNLSDNNDNITLCTGLWDIKRGNMNSYEYKWNRSYDEYINYLKELLSTNKQIVVFGDMNIKDIVEQYKNAKFIFYPIEKFYTKFPYYEKVNKIRLNKEWFEQNDASWLKNSPQAELELFNPVTMSKMYFLNLTSQLNPFKSKKIYWVDAGIIRTHDKLIFENLEEKIKKYNKFLFLKFKYTNNSEIHGFQRFAINKYCNTQNDIDYVARAQFFGGVIENINNIVEKYNNMLDKTLNDGYMGTEESIFTIITCIEPELYDLVWINEYDGINTLNSL